MSGLLCEQRNRLAQELATTMAFSQKQFPKSRKLLRIFSLRVLPNANSPHCRTGDFYFHHT